MKRCDEGMAVCSMDLRIEPEQGIENNAGMSGARFRCCIVPEAAVLISQGNLKHTGVYKYI